MAKTINKIEDLAEYLGTSVNSLKHDVYKYTECGAWIKWNNEGIIFGSIVEGSDAEFSDSLQFPFSADDYESAMEYLEQIVNEAWLEANDDIYESEED